MTQAQQISAGVTLLATIAIVILLLLIRLAWIEPPSLAPQRPQITMAELDDDEEFLDVQLLDTPVGNDEDGGPAYLEETSDAESQPAPESGADLKTQGQTGSPNRAVTQTSPSTVTEKVKPADNPAAAVDNTRKQEQATSERTRNEVSSAFNNSANRNNALNGNKDNGPAGSPSGNTSSLGGPNATGTRTGVPSGTVGGGWRIPQYSRSIPSNNTGTVVFEVSVDSDGKVTDIKTISNKGLQDQTIARCIAEINKHKFKNSDPENAKPAVARITFRFVDPD